MESRTITFAVALGLSVALPAEHVHADDGGVSFWLPGLFGSLAAAPGQPGWGFQSLYLHEQPGAGAGTEFPRGGRIDTGIKARADLFGLGGAYVFETPVLGAQPNLSLLAVAGHMHASIDATLTGPRGNVFTGSRTDERWGIGDLFPMAQLKWNRGNGNWMTYLTGDVPVGAYNPNRLANFGIGHGAIDWGAGYTYLNAATGWEASATIGATYNFENNDTQYRNGIDGHLDWGVSRFLSPKMHVGLVGYAYQQITGDSGAGAKLGDFKSRVFGIGPQAGFLMPIAGMQGYINVKGYGEFGAENRPEGWNVWLTFALTPAAPPATSPSMR
jgi:hypothetical protein